jgi:hypothetical protein
MRYVFAALLAVVALALVAAPATADWDDTEPFKWVQFPDMDWGMNVWASPHLLPDPENPGDFVMGQKFLADDWECTQTGFVTDIHIWGSWLFDILPKSDSGGPASGDPGNVSFVLSIHEDIPEDGDLIPFSRPVLDPLWEMTVTASEVREWQIWTEEFWDPNIPGVVGDDTIIYQYNFFFDPLEAFEQLGTIDEPIVYWLNVSAIPDDPEAVFGWKTSWDHWNDDAVFWDEWPDGTTGPVGELRDYRFADTPSLDMAFVITPEPGTLAMLLGAGLIGLVACGRRRLN